MRRSMLSEKKVVVVLFIMVLVTFFFAQADSSKIEQMYLNNDPTVTTSVDQVQTPKPGIKSNETHPDNPAVQLR
ncbi:MAG: hypothetical protein ACHQFX_13930 [Chitinophagales bacterium]